jgi:hypothetical protein
MAVTIINVHFDPPNGSNEAILTDNTPSFALSIQKANMNQRINKPKNPAKKALPDLWCINKATNKATTAKNHHIDIYMPAIKLNKAVKTVAIKNFILIRFSQKSFSILLFCPPYLLHA